MSEPSQLDALLRRLEAKDPAAERELFPLLYEELHGIAKKQMANQREGHTLQATALVNEAWLKLTHGERKWTDRTHFLKVASAAMRQVLVDHARRKKTLKRGEEATHGELDEFVQSLEQGTGSLIELDEALLRLAQRDPKAVLLVNLHFFGGCTMAEMAEVLGVSERHAARTWRVTRLLLKEELERGAT